MNTEEKAKAYDEALDRMKHVVVAPKNEKALQALKETIFPEPAVSEDERTRRKLIEFILDVKRISEEGRSTWAVRKDDVEMCNTFISYLEKQKEQKPAQTEEEREYVKTLKGLVSDFLRDSGGGITDVEYYQNICDWLDGRHIEQKPNIEICPHSIKSKSYLETDYPIEQKPVVTHGETYHVDTLGTQQVIAGKMPQKPAEWSEEDDWKRKELIQYLEEKGDYRTVWMTWLKSLRPQPHWKPSNEQINYLGAAVIEAQRRHNESVNGFPRYRALKELYEQLLKL